MFAPVEAKESLGKVRVCFRSKRNDSCCLQYLQFSSIPVIHRSWNWPSITQVPSVQSAPVKTTQTTLKTSTFSISRGHDIHRQCAVLWIHAMKPYYTPLQLSLGSGFGNLQVLQLLPRLDVGPADSLKDQALENWDDPVVAGGWTSLWNRPRKYKSRVQCCQYFQTFLATLAVWPWACKTWFVCTWLSPKRRLIFSAGLQQFPQVSPFGTAPAECRKVAHGVQQFNHRKQIKTNLSCPSITPYGPYPSYPTTIRVTILESSCLHQNPECPELPWNVQPSAHC